MKKWISAPCTPHSKNLTTKAPRKRHVDRAAELLMPARTRRSAAPLLASTVSALVLVACSSGGSSTPSPSSSPVNASSAPVTATSSTPDESASPTRDPDPFGADAEEILTKTFADREPLGGGSGALQPDIGNTLADTPKKVLSVTFAFVCTGAATVQLSVTVGVNAPNTSKKSTYLCDQSVNQQTVELATPGPVSFQATVKGGAIDGTYAFGYYAEKTQA